MPLLLPNLDDRKWAELVDQGRALIPVYGPEWTDHNASDPGITLIELLAWIAEMDIYELNQISDRERQKFLKLVDVVPKGPLPAEAAMCITLDNGASLSLPAGVEFTAMMLLRSQHDFGQAKLSRSRQGRWMPCNSSARTAFRTSRRHGGGIPL